jgi:hypothetical protein
MQRKPKKACWLRVAVVLLVYCAADQAAGSKEWQEAYTSHVTVARLNGSVQVAYGGHNFELTTRSVKTSASSRSIDTSGSATPIDPSGRNNSLPCGKGRVRNAQTHQCRGPADIGR